MNHIFISYYHDDNDFAENLIHKLHDAGFSTWRDKDELYAGEVWRVEIDQAITNASAMIVIMTPDAKKSEYVTYEWAFAFGVGVKIIPLMLRKTELHPRLEDIQYLDFTNNQYRPWQKLIDTVRAIVNKTNRPFIVPRDTPAYIKKSIEALDSPNPSDREGAINILVKDSKHPVVQQILPLALEHDLREVRMQMALSIARLPDIPVQALRGLLEALQVRQYNARATEALGKMGKIAVPELCNALYDKNTQVRSGAIKALGMIGDIAAVPNLLQIARDTSEDGEVRSSAIISLAKIRNEAALLGLLDIIHSEQEALNEFKELYEKQKDMPVKDEDDYMEKVVLPQHIIGEIHERIQTLKRVLCGLPDGDTVILKSKLHIKDCETCSGLMEELKMPSRR